MPKRIICPECRGTGRKSWYQGNAFVSTEKEHCPNCTDGNIDDPDFAQLEKRIAEIERRIKELDGTL